MKLVEVLYNAKCVLDARDPRAAGSPLINESPRTKDGAPSWLFDLEARPKLAEIRLHAGSRLLIDDVDAAWWEERYPALLKEVLPDCDKPVTRAGGALPARPIN